MTFWIAKCRRKTLATRDPRKGRGSSKRCTWHCLDTITHLYDIVMAEIRHVRLSKSIEFILNLYAYETLKLIMGELLRRSPRRSAD